MEHIRIFRSPIGRGRTFRPGAKSDKGIDSVGNDSQPTSDEEYDSDALNATGVLNHSRLQIVKASQLTEPPGWYSGREYFVVTRGSSVGLFHKLSVVITISLPTPLILFEQIRSKRVR